MYDRSLYLKLDDQGVVDPLGHPAVDRILEITEYTEIFVDTDMSGRLDKISINNYGVDDLGWVIQVYNGFHSVRQFVQGVLIRIPNKGAVDRALADPETNRPVAVTRQRI